jgi:CheY-like chemotaxis protein
MPTGEAIATQQRILVVDDDQTVIEVVRRVLEAQGHEVDIAYDGRAGVTLIEQTEYDLIILDFNMPELDGIEVYYFIEQLNPDLTRRVVFITGDADRPQVRSFLEVVDRPVLTKPFTKQKLLAFVERALL